MVLNFVTLKHYVTIYYPTVSIMPKTVKYLRLCSIFSRSLHNYLHKGSYGSACSRDIYMFLDMDNLRLKLVHFLQKYSKVSERFSFTKRSNIHIHWLNVWQLFSQVRSKEPSQQRLIYISKRKLCLFCTFTIRYRHKLTELHIIELNLDELHSIKTAGFSNRVFRHETYSVRSGNFV